MSSYTEIQLDELIKKTEKFNYLKFGIALFIALTTSHLFSDWIEWEIVTYKSEVAAKELEKKLKAEEALAEARMKKEAENLAARNAEIARQQEQYQAQQKRIAEENRIKSENAAEAQRKKAETCRFWIEEYNKSKLTGDMYHRNNACRDAGTPFN
ncbi:hypothetical protein [Cellvibrio sp.]|uniref:hypothetical protein n=1 Tax=Cellvibrio sp. TaxID=1965322 RepID=UPI0039647E5D